MNKWKQVLHILEEHELTLYYDENISKNNQNKTELQKYNEETEVEGGTTFNSFNTIGQVEFVRMERAAVNSYAMGMYQTILKERNITMDKDNLPIHGPYYTGK